MRSAVHLWLIVVLSLAIPLRAPSVARADTPPGTWDLAKDPAERQRWELHVRVQRLLHPPASDEVLPPELRRDEELRLEAARAMLDEVEAANSPDLRLRFDLGIVYEQLATLQGRDELHRQVIAVLAPALEAAPDHPAATEALESLVYAYAKLDLPREELATWRRYIARLADERSRATPMMNMGEAEMRLGKLEEAIGTFRNVLQICGTLSNSSARNSTYALALWDLAVALDRAGDPRGAMETAAKARQMSWAEPAPLGQIRSMTGWDAIRDERNVFFVPAWEREWYLALGEASAALDERESRVSASLWARAEEHWGAYVARASASRGDDRWLGIARVRRDRAHAERVAADARAAKPSSRPQSASKKDEPGDDEHRL